MYSRQVIAFYAVLASERWGWIRFALAPCHTRKWGGLRSCWLGAPHACVRVAVVIAFLGFTALTGVRLACCRVSVWEVFALTGAVRGRQGGLYKQGLALKGLLFTG